MVIDINNTKNKYALIYTDPPWKQQKSGGRKCRPNQEKELDYPTMTLEEIKQLHWRFLCKNASIVHIKTL